MSKEFKIKQKVEKDFSSFSDVVNNMGKEELEKELFRLANYREEVQLAKGEDEGLKNAQEEVRAMAGPYNDTLKALKLKSTFIHIILKERGHING